MKIRLATAITLIVAGTACSWYWWEVSNQYTFRLGTARVETQDELRAQFPMLWAAFKLLDVDVIARSEDSGIRFMRLGGQVYRLQRLGMVLILIGIQILLLTKTDSKRMRIPLIVSRLVVAVLLSVLLYRIWFSWNRWSRNLGTGEMSDYPNNALHAIAASAAQHER